MKPIVTMRAALADPELFGNVLSGDSWAAWRVLLIACMGEELTPDERAVFTTLTGREREPLERVDELWAIVGRRGGKTRAIATLASYIAALVDWSDVLAPGERASLPIMSASTWQAAKAKQFVSGIFASVPALSAHVQSETSDTIALSTKVDIEIRPASFRTSRGGTCVAAIADEVAFWRSENAANPDKEILDAIRPSLATTGGMLACISSPYAKRGELYATWKRDFGEKGDPGILVAKAASRTMNPSLSEKVVKRAYERDAAAAAAEYGGEFRTDVENFLSADVVDAAIVPDRFELPRIPGVTYVGFVDPSGGSADDMSLCVAHKEGETVIVDCIRAVAPPFSPDGVVADFAATLKAYGLSRVKGDRYGGAWPAERFAAHGVEYEPSELPKSDLYKETLPLLNAGRVQILDHKKLSAQLTGLERRTARGGRDSIDHAPGAHDDIANAVAGAIVAAMAGDGALVKIDEYLTAGVPSELPQPCDLIFASLVVVESGPHCGRAAAAIWADGRRHGYPLVLIDTAEGVIGDAFLRALCERMATLSEEARPIVGFSLIADDSTVRLYDSIVITMEGKPALFGQAIDWRDPRLPARAAVHVNNGSVKLGARALELARNTSLGAALGFHFGREQSEQASAIMTGIIGALEPRHSAPA